MVKNRSGKAYAWWYLVLSLGIVVFVAIALYGETTYWFRVPCFSATQRLLGCFIDFVELLLLLTSLLYVRKLSGIAREGEVFSRSALHAAGRAFLFFLVWTIYAPIARTLTCLVVTMHNPVGHRLLSVGVGTPDLIRLLILAAFAFLLLVLRRGIDLSEDQSLTI